MDADPDVVLPGGNSFITVQAVDPEGDQLAFSWQATGGSVAPQDDQAVWTAPQTSGGFSIEVTVSDGKGATTSAFVPVTVQVPKPPGPPPPPPPPPAAGRDPATWPFDKLAPWNRPIGANADYQPIVSGLTGGGFTTGFINHRKWTVSFWIASPSDPVRKIYSKNWAGSLKGSGEFIERRIPDAAVPSPDSDGDMLVISPDHSTVLEFYRAVRLSNGDLQVANADEVDLKGMGTTGIVTNGMSLAGGAIRAGELKNGIKHALAFTTSAKMWNRNAPAGQTFVWPARRADHYANNPEPDGYGSSGNLFMGSLVAISPTVNVNALGLETPAGLVIARALQDYGAYGATTGGSGARIVFRFDYAAYKAGDLTSLLANWTAFQRDLNRIAPRLHVVVNSHTNGQAPTLGPTEGIGGGAPRTSFAPDFPISQGQPIDMVAAAAGILLLRGRARRPRR